MKLPRLRPLGLALAILCPPLIGACGGGGGAMMTPGEIATNGTHSFAFPPAEVFAATVGALRTQGYVVTVANEEKGIIKTDRKPLRAQAIGGGGVAVAVEVTRQYYVRIESTDPGNTTVVADPKVFIGERDVTGDKVWRLEGPEGERELWRRLFAEIQSNL